MTTNNENCLHVRAVAPNTGLTISTVDLNQVITATNNKAQYFAEQAKKYKNEAKEFCDNARYYAEQNSDVTKAYVDGIAQALETQISAKQDSGEYVTTENLTDNLATKYDASNPSNYQTLSQVNSVISTHNNELTAHGDLFDEKADANLSNLSATGEARFTGKVDVSSLAEINPMLVSYASGTEGYNIWANGYCEQWGQIPVSTTSITLLKTMKDADYQVFITYYKDNNTGNVPANTISTITQTVGNFTTASSAHIRIWKASGYLADGEY